MWWRVAGALSVLYETGGLGVTSSQGRRRWRVVGSCRLTFTLTGRMPSSLITGTTIEGKFSGYDVPDCSIRSAISTRATTVSDKPLRRSRLVPYSRGEADGRDAQLQPIIVCTRSPLAASYSAHRLKLRVTDHLKMLEAHQFRNDL